MKFRIIDDRTGEPVLGGDVSEDNVYIRGYGSVLDGYPLPTDLQPGERTLKRYALSGAKPTVYAVLRIE